MAKGSVWFGFLAKMIDKRRLYHKMIVMSYLLATILKPFTRGKSGINAFFRKRYKVDLPEHKNTSRAKKSRSHK